MEKLNTRQVKDRLLNTLLAFQSYCRENDLRFYLSAGTLLGAIRHQGFIPWDDDVDVCMARPDYDKLLEIAKNESSFAEHYQIECFFLGNSNYPFVKIVDTDTKIDPAFMEEEGTDSLFVDVFPVDGLPNNTKKIKKTYQRAELYRKVLMLNSAKLGTGKSKLKTLIKPLFMPAAKLVGAKRCNKALDQLARTYNFDSSKKVASIMWGLYGTGEVMPYSGFKQSVDVTFEGHTFKTMSCWKEYLVTMYGDYMKLPPKESRRIHLLEAWKK